MNFTDQVEYFNETLALNYEHYMIDKHATSLSKQDMECLTKFINYAIEKENKSLDIPRKNGVTLRQMDEYKLNFKIDPYDAFLEARVPEGYYMILNNLTYVIDLDNELQNVPDTKPKTIEEAILLANQHYCSYRVNKVKDE